MRYKYGVQCMMPYVHMNEDGSTDRSWAKFTFRGDVDRRRVKRELTKWVKRELGRKLSAFERDMIIKRSNALPEPEKPTTGYNIVSSQDAAHLRAMAADIPDGAVVLH